MNIQYMYMSWYLIYQVRTRSEDGEGEWRTVSTIFGKMGTLLYNDVICLAITRVQYMSWYLICQSVFLFVVEAGIL